MSIKSTHNVFRSILATIIIAYTLLLGLLNFGPTERTLTRYVAELLSDKLGTEVSIGNIEVGLFNRVVLQDVRIADRQHKPLLTAKAISAKIALKSLFEHQLTLRTISLLDADLNLYKEKADSATNFQFVLDAFASKDKKKKSELDLRINSIIIRRTNVVYNELFKPVKSGKFDLAHIAVKRANANISLKSITPQNIHLRVRSLSLQERSGLKIDQLRFDILANLQHASIRNFLLEMPHSHLALKRLQADYDSRNGFSKLWPTLSLKTSINDWIVSSSDLRPIVEIPTDIDLTLRLSSHISVSRENVVFKNFSVEDLKRKINLFSTIKLIRNGSTFSSLQLQLQRLHAEQNFINQVALWTHLKEQPQQIISRIGNIDANGNATLTSMRNGMLKLNLHTGIGDVNVGGTFHNKQVDATIEAINLRPDLLLMKEELPTNINFLTHVRANLKDIKCPMAQLETDLRSAVWNGYKFQSIHATANYDVRTLSATLKSNDPNAWLDATIQMALNGENKPLAINLRSSISNFVPSALGLSTPYEQASFSGVIDADINNFNKPLPLGHINVKNFKMLGAPRGNYECNNLAVDVSENSSHHQDLSIRSDFLDADLSGMLSIERIKNGVFSILHRSLPGLSYIPLYPSTDIDKWRINAHLKKADVLNKMLGLGFGIHGDLNFKGTLDASPRGYTSLTFYGGGLDINGTILEKPSFYLTGKEGAYHCLVQAHKEFSGRDYKVAANFSTLNGELTSKLEWNGIAQQNYNGSLECVTRFFKSASAPNFDMYIRPTQIALADTIWNIASGHISHINNNIAISGVELSHDNQGLRIDGEIAPGQNDSIVARLQNIDIDYILDMVDFDAVSFGGQASGDVVFTQKNHQPQLHANLLVPDFTFNNGIMGMANIHGEWNKADNRINLNADMRLPNTPGYGTKVKGYVSLAEKGLDLHIQTDHTRLLFLRRYIDDLFGNFDGDATGNVRLFGPFKKLDFEGKVQANCSAKVLSTGVDYRLTDGHVEFAPGKFVFNDFKISDRQEGTGRAYGELRHTHLKNLNYEFNVTADHMLCYNKGKDNDMPFYSTTTGTGNVKLSGRPKTFLAVINLTPNAPTTFVYDLGTQTSLSKDDRMIRFHAINDATSTPLFSNEIKVDTIVAPVAHTATTEDYYGTDITLDFTIYANPTAQLRIITDPRSGDALTAYGDGTLHAIWHNKGSFEMNGTYSLTHGEYKISLQDIIRKNLAIQPGSYITFNGNPLDAILALKTVYTVNGVSLNDLNYGAGFSNKTVRADCILNIGGLARSPQVSFDLDFHNISEDEKQMVRQLISTDEDMSKQVMCLLGMGRFLTATATTSTGDEEVNSSQQSAAAMRSFLSTTLTSQLNSVISSALGSQSKWSFGTNFMPGAEGWNNMEVDGLVQGRLFNDRLLINGNFGYRDNPTYTSNFVGDFDIRYLLTPRGSVSLRAYSETNDRYFTKSSLTTQGVGITLQRDFNTLKDLFKVIYRRSKKKTTSTLK